MKRILFATLAVVIMSILSCKKDKDSTPPTMPLVTTAALTSIGGGNYTGGGSIVSDGGATITKSGVTMSLTNATPTIADSLLVATATTGAFTINLSGIDFGKTYYFRAFATNSVGTGYGSVVTLTTSNDSVRFTYNGQSVTYGIITSPTTGKKWLDRNIGAKQVATAYNDYLAYGDLFQWGRPADGHQLINWTASNAGTPVNGMTATIAVSDIPGHANFIDGTNAVTPSGDPSKDWRSDNNSNRWATVPQGPCPAGWHVPTLSEWMAEVANTGSGGTATSGGITNGITAYDKLKLTGASIRRGVGSNAGQLVTALAGNYGFYSSSTDQMSPSNYSEVRTFTFDQTTTAAAFAEKARGLSVRCIKD